MAEMKLDSPSCGEPLRIKGVTRNVLQRASIDDGAREALLVKVTYPGGTAAPPHRHPVGGLVYILEGSAESAYGDETPRRYHAGDALRDQADLTHTVFRNCDPDRPLRFLTFYTIRPGEEYAVLA